MSRPIVPQSVIMRYLSGYSERQLNEIEDTYEKIHAELFAGPLFLKQDRILLLTAGAAGAGKSTHLKAKVDKIARTEGRRFVHIDIDQILPQFPSFKWCAGQLSEYFMDVKTDEHRRALRETTTEWTLAAKHVADRLLNDAVALGVPVAFETSAHNNHIQDFFEGARANGYQIEIDLCDAPLSVKQDASRERFDRGEAYVDPAAITRKHEDVITNMPNFARNADRLNILWREHAHKDLTLVATSEPSGNTIHDRHGAKCFDDTHRGDAGITVGTMLQMTMHARAQRANQSFPRTTLG